MRIRLDLNLGIGRVVRYFILVDLFLFAGWGIIDPIFSVFIVNKVPGATLVSVGIGTAIYWILKSVIELPAARYLDRHVGEKDDFYALIWGLIIVSLAASSLATIQAVWQLYLALAAKAVGFALYAASWPAMFSRHLDKERVSFDWAMDSVAVGLGAGASGFFGSVIATWLGFRAVFVTGAAFSVCAAVILLLVPDLILPKPTTPNQESPMVRKQIPGRGT